MLQSVLLTFPLCHSFPIGHKIMKLDLFCDEKEISVLLAANSAIIDPFNLFSIVKSCQEGFRKL